MDADIKKGLMGVTVDETSISKVMPEINSLTYRGYAAQDLCANCKFEEVAYLILNGELPTKKQLKNFEKQEKSERKLSKTLLESPIQVIFKLEIGFFFISSTVKTSDKTWVGWDEGLKPLITGIDKYFSKFSTFLSLSVLSINPSP